MPVGEASWFEAVVWPMRGSFGDLASIAHAQTSCSELRNQDLATTTTMDDGYGEMSVNGEGNSEAIAADTFYGTQSGTIADSVRRHNRRSSTAVAGASARNAARKPKLKLKLSEKATAAMASGTSFLGAYDRELDSDDEDLSFEEQFILRMPPGEDCEKLRKLVQSREMSNDVWFKFKGIQTRSYITASYLHLSHVDSRRAVFHIGNNLYSAKLVDLPCIIESQKTLDNKQMFKVADICQVGKLLNWSRFISEACSCRCL